MRLRLVNVAIGGMIAVYVMAAAAGLLGFSLWGQILELVGMRATPAELIASGNVHALRFLVVFPFLWMSVTFGLPQDGPFAVGVALAIVGSSWFVARSVTLVLTGETRQLRFVWFPILLLMLGLSLAMNGRIAFSFLGYAILTHLMVLFQAGRIRSSLPFVLGVFPCLLLLSVSTGTFLVGVGSLAVFALAQPVWRRRGVLERRTVVLFGVILGVLGLLMPIVGQAVTKNIEFYGGGLRGVVRMLQHGAGRVLPDDLLVLGVLTCVGVVMACLALDLAKTRIQSSRLDACLWMAMAFAFAGGLFGFSTMMVGLPLGIGLAVMVLYRKYGLRRTILAS